MKSSSVTSVTSVVDVMRHAVLSLFAALALSAGEAVKRPSGPVAPNTKPGSILCEYFKGIRGQNVNDLCTNPAFPNKPSETLALNLFEIPADSDDNYGTAVRGFLYPPANGNYTFWIASDDGSELWLSPSENPADKVKICQLNGASAPRAWDSSPQQKSKPIQLYAGRRYYIEALHKEGEGGDNLSVGWQLPDGKMERPIPGARLAPAVTAKPPPPVNVAIQGTLPSKPGFHKCMAKITGAGAPFDFPFLLYVPNDFGKYPVPSLLFLHGVGEAGTDLEGVYGNGPHGHVRNDKTLREKMPFLIIGPQLVPGRSWSQRPVIKSTVALLDEILKGYGNYVDKDRVCMTGLSMGGAGTWNVALEAPDRFAAIVPSDPRAVMPESAAERLKEVAVWIIAGAEDGDFTKGAKEMFEALKNNIPKPQLILVPNCGHGAWGYYYPKWQFYEWMLKWRRSPARAAQAIAAAAAEKKAALDAAKEVVKAPAKEPAKEPPPAKEVPPTKENPPAKVAEVKPVQPPPTKPDPAKVTPPAPADVAKPVAPAPVKQTETVPVKPPEKPVEVAKTETYDELIKRLASARPAAPENPAAPAKQAVQAVAALPQPIVPSTPPPVEKNLEPVIKIEPKVLPATVEAPPAPLVVQEPIPPIEEPKVETHATSSRFPYAPVSLLIAMIFFVTAAYFLTTKDE